MARSRTKSDAAHQAADEATLAHRLAPEEIRPGDYVAVLHDVIEFPTWYWCDEASLTPRDELVRILYIPREDAVPQKIRAVCLPFVFAKKPCGGQHTLDVRRTRVARLDRAYAAAAWKSYKKSARKARRAAKAK